MSPSERSQEKRQRVLHAAMTRFIQFGFEGTSMDTIAAEAAVSKPTLYRYFPNKEALFVAVLRDLVVSQPEAQTFDPLTVPLQTVHDLEAALTDWAVAAAERATQPAYTGLVRLLIAEMPRFPELGPMFYEAVPQQGAADLGALLNRAEQNGLIAIPDYEAVIRLIAGGLLTYTLGSGLFGSGAQPPTRDQISPMMRLIIQALIQT